MSMLQEGLEGLKSKISLVADWFYQQKVQAGYRELISIIDDITAVSVILEVNKEREDVCQLHQRLSESLQSIMAAMEHKDTVLIADTMSYELLDLIDELIEMKLG